MEEGNTKMYICRRHFTKFHNMSVSMIIIKLHSPEHADFSGPDVRGRDGGVNMYI
jgi:hypothetical protein